MTNHIAQARIEELLPNIVSLARQAGQAIMTIYEHVDLAVEYKRDNSPLTQADLSSHHLIVEGLARLTPDWPVLSEESAEIPFEQRGKWQRFWMVDPLDGTKEFLRRNGEFTVNIALIEDGKPVLGVVYAPAIDKMYFALQGKGAFKEDGDTVTQIATASPASGMVRIVVSRSHEDSHDRFKEEYGDCPLVPMGSSLKFCLVAEGAADVYPRTGPTMEWDTAAAQCIVEVAGGSVTDAHGNPLKYNKPVLLNSGFIAKAGPCASPVQAQPA